MRLEHDRKADAIYVYLNDKPYAYGKDLDYERRIDYSDDGAPRGAELLCVSEGVNLDGLPSLSEIAKALEENGIKFYRMVSRSDDDGVIINIDLAYLETEKSVTLSLKDREGVTV